MASGLDIDRAGYRETFVSTYPGSYAYNMAEAAGYCHHGYPEESCSACERERQAEVDAAMDDAVQGHCPKHNHYSYGECPACGEERSAMFHAGDSLDDIPF